MVFSSYSVLGEVGFLAQLAVSRRIEHFLELDPGSCPPLQQRDHRNKHGVPCGGGRTGKVQSDSWHWKQGHSYPWELRHGLHTLEYEPDSQVRIGGGGGLGHKEAG